MSYDGFLRAEFYIGLWDHSDEDETARGHKVLEAVQVPREALSVQSPGIHVSVNVWHTCDREVGHEIDNWFDQPSRENYVSDELLAEILEGLREDGRADVADDIAAAIARVEQSPEAFDVIWQSD